MGSMAERRGGEQLKKKKEKTSPNWKAKTRFASALSRFARNYERVTIARWNDVFFLYSPLHPLPLSFTLSFLSLCSFFILHFTVEGERDAHLRLDERRASRFDRTTMPRAIDICKHDPNLSPFCN